MYKQVNKVKNKNLNHSLELAVDQIKHVEVEKLSPVNHKKNCEILYCRASPCTVITIITNGTDS